MKEKKDVTHVLKLIDRLIADGSAKSYHDMCLKIGKSGSYFSEIKSGRMNITNDVVDRICNTFTNVNRDYIMYGEGDMFITEEVVCEYCQDVPCVPVGIYQQPNISMADYINKEQVNRVKLSKSFGNIDAIYMVRDCSMNPNYEQSDMLGIRMVTTEQIINGNAYVIDTKSRGILLRTAHLTDDGSIRLVPLYKDRYSEFTVQQNDIYNIYSVIYLIRTNL